MKVNRSELIDLIAQDTGLSKTVVKKVILSFTRQIGSQLWIGNEVYLPLIGTLSAVDVNPQKKMDIKTGQLKLIDSHRRVKFRPSMTLNRRLNKNM